MILVGQMDSPFVRRVAIVLNHHGIDYDRQVMSVFENFDDMLEINPLGKVPTLILNDGTHLYDSRAIIEYLENITPIETRLTPVGGTSLTTMLAIEAMGIGLAEKIYERGIEYSRRRPGAQDPAWIERMETQIFSVLCWLEARATPEWFVGEKMTRADIAVTVALTYVSEKLPQLFDIHKYSKLAAYRIRMEELAVFSHSAYSETEAKATGWRPEQY